MRYEVRAVVRAAPDQVWAWWTDHGPVGHKERVHHGLGWSDRTILSREGDVIEMRESVLGIRLLTHRVELHPARRAFRETSDAYEAWWSFEAHPDGTLVRREVEVRGRSARLAPRGLTAWAAHRDLQHHARECERALSA